MSLFIGNGNPLNIGSGYEIEKYNLWTGENDLMGYRLGSNYNSLTADETSNVAVFKLLTGHTYWIASNGSGAWIYSLPPDGETVPSGGTTFASGVWHRFLLMINGNGTVGSEYQCKFTPQQDWYLYIPYAVDGGIVVVTEQEGIMPDDSGNDLLSNTGGLIGYNADGTVKGTCNWYSSPNVGQAVNIDDDSKIATQMSIAPAQDIYDSRTAIFWIGDSITYAASNAGIKDAYRKEITYKYNIRHAYKAVAGICATDGYGISWDSSDGAKTGASGFISVLDVSSSFTAQNTFKQCSLCVLALGTNDFGNNAPLGTLGNGDTTTFYGAYQKYIDHIRGQNPTIPIVIILPFKRENWNTKNEAGNVLTDYCYAICDIAYQYKSIYILDLFDKWYLDYDNENVRSKFFLDYVHPSGAAHRMIATELGELIPRVLLMEGIPIYKQ